MSKKVLVVVDVQNDFVKGGALGYGYPKESNTNAVIGYATDAVLNGDYVVATRDTHHGNYPETLEGQKLPVQHCIHQTKGWELIFGLNALARDGKMMVFDKPTFGTPLIAQYVKGLIDGGEDISEIELIGYCTSICVAANAVILRAHFPNKKIVVRQELCGDIDEESHNAALKVLRNQQIDII